MATKIQEGRKFLNHSNAETDLASHTPGSIITPPGLHFVRARTPIPQLSKKTWRLDVFGDVNERKSFTFNEIESMVSRSITVTMACAGLGRSAIVPSVSGEQWNHGAVSTAVWTGVPLSALLRRTGIKSSAKKLVFSGADSGHITDDAKNVAFERSLDLTKALEGDAIIAFSMNGRPLPREHGYPVRLVVPKWYGMASVKWLTSIEAVSQDRHLFYNHDRYVKVGREGAVTPVSLMGVHSVIANIHPAKENRQKLVLDGFAWSGHGEIRRVEISADEGRSWETARLTNHGEAHAWQQWSHLLRPSQRGSVKIISRAQDSKGNIQPMESIWNKFGYANNAVHAVNVPLS